MPEDEDEMPKSWEYEFYKEKSLLEAGAIFVYKLQLEGANSRFSYFTLPMKNIFLPPVVRANIAPSSPNFNFIF